MPPMPLTPPCGPSRYLTLEERIAIFVGLQLGNSYAEIARCLGRVTSTVTRELDLYRKRPHLLRAAPVGRTSGHRVAKTLNYCPSVADARAEAARRRPKTGKLAACPRLRKQVQTRLRSVTARSRSRAGCGWTSPTMRR